MNSNERDEYITYRMDRARETLREAQELQSAGHYFGSANRIYYAMFYAVNALALSRDFTTSSHAQLRGYFNREFVKTGLVPVALGQAFGAAYDCRTKSDYQDMVEIPEEQVTDLLADAVDFIDFISDVLKK